MMFDVPANIYEDPFFLYGKHIIVHEGWTPKMQLSEDCPVTPEFRKEMNEWMLDFFGKIPFIPDGEAWLINDKIAMNPNTLQQFRSKLPPFVDFNPLEKK